MYSENGVLIDFAEVGKVIESADIFVAGFANFPERLLVDTRSNRQEAPLVQVVQPSAGPQQRIAWLKRRRPSLGDPESFVFFAWPHSAGFMLESGMWNRIVRRVDAGFDPAVKAQCDLAIQQLQNLDDAVTMALLRGENCMTLWPPEPD